MQKCALGPQPMVVVTGYRSVALGGQDTRQPYPWTALPSHYYSSPKGKMLEPAVHY